MEIKLILTEAPRTNSYDDGGTFPIFSRKDTLATLEANGIPYSFNRWDWLIVQKEIVTRAYIDGYVLQSILDAIWEYKEENHGG